MYWEVIGNHTQGALKAGQVYPCPCTSYKYDCLKLLGEFQWQADKSCFKETPD